MSPILLVSDDNKSTKKFIKQFRDTQSIEAVNVLEIQPEKKEISIDQIREIKTQIAYSFSQPRLFVLHQFDSASYQAQNALLKTLEEHAQNVYFILIVNTLYDILPTIRSRCKVANIKDLGAESPVGNDLNSSLEKVISGKAEAPIVEPTFQVSGNADALELIDQMITFFRARFLRDKNASSAIRTLFITRSLILHNNLNPQLAVDHIIIGLQKKYST